MGEYRAWQADRAAAVARASAPSIGVYTATELAHDGLLARQPGDEPIEVVDLPRPSGRPFGPRFGSLVHATLATVPLEADDETVLLTAGTHARLLLASPVEVSAASDAVVRALAHPLFERVRAASAVGRCSRECPILWRAPDGSIVEGTVDVVFEEEAGLVVVDFKTDREPAELKDQYERQLTLYCRAFSTLRGRRARGVLVRV
jgi:ATP-dependent exoDNAse (exonuclease V) beta subunit